MYRIYLFEQEELVPDDFIKKTLPLLPEERRKKALRYRNRIDRNNCVFTYLMLRIALKECFQIKDFTVQYSQYEKVEFTHETPPATGIASFVMIHQTYFLYRIILSQFSGKPISFSNCSRVRCGHCLSTLLISFVKLDLNILKSSALMR